MFLSSIILTILSENSNKEVIKKGSNDLGVIEQTILSVIVDKIAEILSPEWAATAQ